MPRKRYKPEEIVAKLRQVDVLVSQGQSMADATQATTPRWEPRAGSTVDVISGNCPGWGLGSEQAEGIRQGCRIAGQGVDDGPALLLGG
jgi:hypothetical protein